MNHLSLITLHYSYGFAADLPKSNSVLFHVVRTEFSESELTFGENNSISIYIRISFLFRASLHLDLLIRFIYSSFAIA